MSQVERSAMSSAGGFHQADQPGEPIGVLGNQNQEIVTLPRELTYAMARARRTD